MKTAILTEHYEHDEAYSLCQVIDTQLTMLPGKKILVVDEAFPKDGTPWHRDDIELRRIPGVPRSNRIAVDETWDEDIEKLRAAMVVALEGVTHVITHDMAYQPAQIKHWLAAAQIADVRPDLFWLHWIHSATNSFMTQRRRFREEPFPNSKLVFPNAYDVTRVANNYRVPETDVVHVPHATDPSEFLLSHPLSRRLAADINLWDADIIGCYPVRLDEGKQVELGLEVFAALKRMKLEIRYVVFDFHSTGGNKVTYRKRLKRDCKKLGLQIGREIVFMSEWSKETHVRSPHAMIRDLMVAGDLFVLPSKSESFSLIAQEAALCKNLLLLNFDFPPIRSIYGEDALYAKFSSNIDVMSGEDGETNTKYDSTKGYFDLQAKRVLSRLDTMVLRQFRHRRKHATPQQIYRDYLEPLLHSWDVVPVIKDAAVERPVEQVSDDAKRPSPLALLKMIRGQQAALEEQQAMLEKMVGG